MVRVGPPSLCLPVLLWTVLVPLSAEPRTPADDQPQVIGSREPIIAIPGEDVILPCHLEPKHNVQGLTVEWAKLDLKPDPSDQLSRVEYVHLYRHGREVAEMQIESYNGRTKLFKDKLQEGNISLKITNVTLSDDGRYRCFIPKLKSPVNQWIVQLVVEPNSVKTWTTEMPTPTPDPDPETDNKGGRRNLIRLISPVVACVILIAVVGVCVYLYKDKCQKQNWLKYDVAPNSPPVV